MSKTMITSLSLILIAICSISHSQTVTCDGNCKCPTSVSGQMCILNCYGEDICKDGTLTCRSGDSCHVNCLGDNACSGNSKIDGSGATDVSINCDGEDACTGNTVLDCGTGACSVYCGYDSSCESATINAPNSDSFVCSGDCGPTESVPAPFTPPPTPKPTTKAPTLKPTTKSPTNKPTTKSPTNKPTVNPTENPSKIPTLSPVDPTKEPTANPIPDPTKNPSLSPSNNPTVAPSKSPSFNPSNNPTLSPSNTPTANPSNKPTFQPSNDPSIAPTNKPSGAPTEAPVTRRPTKEGETYAPTPAPTDPRLSVGNEDKNNTPSPTEENENEIVEGTPSPTKLNAAIMPQGDEGLPLWIFVIIGCTALLCIMTGLLVMAKCGGLMGHQNKFDGKSEDDGIWTSPTTNNTSPASHVSTVDFREGDRKDTHVMALNNALEICDQQNIYIQGDDEVSSESGHGVTKNNLFNNAMAADIMMDDIVNHMAAPGYNVEMMVHDVVNNNNNDDGLRKSEGGGPPNLYSNYSEGNNIIRNNQNNYIQQNHQDMNILPEIDDIVFVEDDHNVNVQQITSNGSFIIYGADETAVDDIDDIIQNEEDIETPQYDENNININNNPYIEQDYNDDPLQDISDSDEHITIA